MAVSAIVNKILEEQILNINSNLIHISTDFVFNGKQDHPYNPNHPREPIGIYGKRRPHANKQLRKYFQEKIWSIYNMNYLAYRYRR